MLMDGRTTGALPNLHWRAVDMVQLRAHPAFTGLPPVEDLALAGPPTYRYVRQDSALWGALHGGVLTTGTLAAALGFYEPAAARRLGIPPAYVSHARLLSAYDNLRAPRFVPEQGPVDLAAALAHNEEAVAYFNGARSAAAVGPAIHPGSGSVVSCLSAAQHQNDAASASSVALLTAAAKRKRRNRHRGTRKAQPGMGAPAGGTASAASASPASAAGGQSERGVGVAVTAEAELARWAPLTWAQMRNKAAAIASAGIGRVRTSWGSAQEAAALHVVMRLFPRAWCCEAGMAWVDWAGIPAAWGFRPGDLPPLAASPDGLLWHAHPHGLPHLGASNTLGQAAAIPSVPASTAGSVEGSTAPEVPCQTAAACLGDNTHCSGGAGGAPAAQQLPVEWGVRLAAGSSLATPSAGPQPTSSTSSRDNSVEALLDRLEELTVAGQAAAAPTAQAPHQLDMGHGQQADSHIQCDSAPEASASSQQPCLDPTARQQAWLEVVEIKNTCPFRGRATVNRKGKQVMEFVLSDQGPRNKVPVQWVPQLQMEMLAAGAASALLASRSATRGIRLYRMPRDEEFLRLMLCAVRKLHLRHILPGRLPPHNMLIADPEYQALLRRTVEVARQAELLAHAQEQASLDGSASSSFFHN